MKSFPFLFGTHITCKIYPFSVVFGSHITCNMYFFSWVFATQITCIPFEQNNHIQYKSFSQLPSRPIIYYGMIFLLWTFEITVLYFKFNHLRKLSNYDEKSWKDDSISKFRIIPCDNNVYSLVVSLRILFVYISEGQDLSSCNLNRYKTASWYYDVLIF